MWECPFFGKVFGVWDDELVDGGMLGIRFDHLFRDSGLFGVLIWSNTDSDFSFLISKQASSSSFIVHSSRVYPHLAVFHLTSWGSSLLVSVFGWGYGLVSSGFLIAMVRSRIVSRRRVTPDDVDFGVRNPCWLSLAALWLRSLRAMALYFLVC